MRGEKIDVIRWSVDPSTYIANALSPARVDKVLLVDTEERQSLVLVAEDQLSLAIGKEGQNVRLAARLTGWKIDIKDIAKYDSEAERQLMVAEAEQLEETEEYDPLETGTLASKNTNPLMFSEESLEQEALDDPIAAFIPENNPTTKPNDQ